MTFEAEERLKLSNFSALLGSVVTVAEICNSVGGSVLFDTPPRCRAVCSGVAKGE